MWDYVFAMYYFSVAHPSELNGLETIIYKQLLLRDTSWMDVHKLPLRMDEREPADRQTASGSRVDGHTNRDAGLTSTVEMTAGTI